MKQLHNILRRQRDLNAVEETSSLLKAKFPVAEVRLFGSKTRGTDDPESDIDLLVLTSREISWRERNAMTDAIYDIQMKYDVVISLLVISQKEWNSGLVSALPIHDIIESEGIAA
jgi:predicted nucleotidyltransferase